MKSKIKNTFKVKWVKFFFPQISASWCDIKWRCKQINKKKTFFVTKISFERCLCVGNVSITHRGSFVLLSFYGELLVIYRFSSNFACLYFGTSHFEHPLVFSELIRPRYGPDDRCDSFSISKTHGVKLSPGVINT